MEGSQICNSLNNDFDLAASGTSNSVSKRRRTQLLGYLFALISSLSGVVMSGFAVVYTDKKIDVVIARCIFQFFCTWPIINYKKIDVFGTSLNMTLLLLLRGFLSATAVTTVHMSFQYLPIGDVTALFYAYPGLVGILARIWLKEPCSFLRILITVLTIVGVLFIAEPSAIFNPNADKQSTDTFADLRWLGIALALVSAFGTAVDCVMLRKFGKKIHFSHSMAYFSLECLIMLMIYLAILNDFSLPCWSDLPLLLGAILAAFCYDSTLILALQRAKAGSIALILSTEVIFAYFVQYFIFKATPSVYGIIGASVIFCCSVATALQEIYKIQKYN